MLGYLSLDIVCSSNLTIFLELRSRKTVRFSEQVMSTDKYPSIFSRQMKAIVNLPTGWWGLLGTQQYYANMPSIFPSEPSHGNRPDHTLGTPCPTLYDECVGSLTSLADTISWIPDYFKNAIRLWLHPKLLSSGTVYTAHGKNWNLSLFVRVVSWMTNRAVFKWLSKVITWLRLLRWVIGLKDSRQFFNQWEAKPKPLAPCTRDFPALRASYR